MEFNKQINLELCAMQRIKKHLGWGAVTLGLFPQLAISKPGVRVIWLGMSSVLRLYLRHRRMRKAPHRCNGEAAAATEVSKQGIEIASLPTPSSLLETLATMPFENSIVRRAHLLGCRRWHTIAIPQPPSCAPLPT